MFKRTRDAVTPARLERVALVAALGFASIFLSVSESNDGAESRRRRGRGRERRSSAIDTTVLDRIVLTIESSWVRSRRAAWFLPVKLEPPETFDDPASFAQGECIATFRRASLVVGATVDVSAEATLAPIGGANVFSARLIASHPFEWLNSH